MVDEVTGILYICSGIWSFLWIRRSTQEEIHGEQKFREVSTVPLSHSIGAQFQHLGHLGQSGRTQSRADWPVGNTDLVRDPGGS